MLHLKFKRLLSPFYDSEKQTQNVFRRFIAGEKEIPVNSGNIKKNFSYSESNKITNSYYGQNNEESQLTSTNYDEYISGSIKYVNIKHAHKTIPFRQGVELNTFIKGGNGWQASGVDIYDSEIGQLKESFINDLFFNESEKNDFVYIDGFEEEFFDVSIEDNKIPFEIINKSGIIEPLAIRDTFIVLQQNIPIGWKISNLINGTLQSGNESIIDNSSNLIEISYNEFSPYKDSFEKFILIGEESILLNNNKLNESRIEKFSILGNDDYYFDNITSIAFSGLKYYNIHKHKSINLSIDHQIDYWGTGSLFQFPLSSSVYISTQTTGSGKTVIVTGSYGTGHITLLTGTLAGTNYPERFSFSINYNSAPGYINPEIGYAGYFSGTTLFPNKSGVYLVPDNTTYYNIPIVFTDHNFSINDPNQGYGLTIDVTIRKSFISEVKIHNYGNNYPIGEYRFGIAENSLFLGSQESTGIGILKIK
jgi:hypothetical protein